MIPYDLESTPLQIKTNSAAGSGELVSVSFFTEAGSNVGNVILYFGSPAKYRMQCMPNSSPFASTLPSEVEKVWLITKLPGPSIKIHCNGILVNVFQPLSLCSASSRDSWSGNVKQMKFSTSDTASDFYKPEPGNGISLTTEIL